MSLDGALAVKVLIGWEQRVRKAEAGREGVAGAEDRVGRYTRAPGGGGRAAPPLRYVIALCVGPEGCARASLWSRMGLLRRSTHV